MAAKFEVQPSKPCWKQRHRENVPADTPLFVQEEGDVPTIHALMAQDRYVAQSAYITPKQLVHMTPERIAQLYEVFKDDMSGNLCELQNEVDHWKAIWEMVNVAEKPDTLDDSRNQSDLYLNLLFTPNEVTEPKLKTIQNSLKISVFTCFNS